MQLKLLADIPDAIPILARWFFDQWGRDVPGNSFEATCERIGEKLNRDQAPLHLVAVEGGRPLGTAQWKIREMAIYPEREFWLGNVYVAPEARGHGLASHLAEEIAQLAKSHGVSELSLQTERLDGGLYARLGWKPVEQVHHHGRDVLVMQRNLM